MNKKCFNSFHFKSLQQLFLLLIFFSAFACSGGKKNNTTENEPIPGWTLLFNGENLDGWEITQFGTQGTIQVSEGNLIIGMGDGCSGVTYTGDFPGMNYEISLDAKKVSGNDFFCGMTFPVDSSYCSLIVGGWGGPVVGLSTIDKEDGSNNETTTLKKFEKDTWYNIRLKVTPEKIEAWIDDEKLIDFETDGHEISIRPEVSLSRPFGICTWITTAHLRNVRIKKIEN
jgi:hypothetical protein